MRSGDIFSGFIYLISGSNSTVGYIQGINGCMQASLIGSPIIIMPAYGLVKACLGLGHPDNCKCTCKGIRQPVSPADKIVVKISYLFNLLLHCNRAVKRKCRCDTVLRGAIRIGMLPS